MKFPLVTFRVSGFVLVWIFSGVVLAAEYPDRSIRLIVPAAPGGGADFVARIVGAKLTESMGQPVVIDNRAGASGTIAAESTAKAAADGHTLFMGQSTSVVIAPQLYAKLGYDTLRDLTPVTLVARVLIALAKVRPGFLNFGSAGNGAPSHLAGEMFKTAAGVTMVHVPYKGAGLAVNALLAGEIQVMFAPSVAVLPQVKAGRLRALAVTSAVRSPAMPDLPTLSESGLPGYDISSWFGLFAPAQTPGPVIDKLFRETARALQSPDVRERLSREGAEPVASSPAEFGAYVRSEFAKYAKLVKDTGIKPD